ncbi:CRE-ORAI-1 protein [Caenorhabditis remanei]|uniref:Protein orai n=1 Tax=Caenorhabditis remanei TaxID=31234 RepID=E3MLB4_CAERE|nr:CRE-ORAI-1 protein [Caenorhabditis remanei]
MPRSHDPSRVELLRQEGTLNEKRVSISVEDIRGAVASWTKTSASGAPITPYPLPQFFLQPPSTGGGSGSRNEGASGSKNGSMNSLRMQQAAYAGKKGEDGVDLGHRGELDLSEKYNYDLSKAQLKASSRTSALLAGFAMVCLVELQYDEKTSKPLLIVLGVVTSLLVSVHLLALMMSTCILPYMEATGCTQDSPHLKLKFYIDLSWLFSTCIGLLLFLVEIGVIFYVKFTAVGYPTAGYITTAMLVPVGIVFVLFSYLIHKNRVSHSLGRFKDKVDTMKQFLDVEANLQKSTIAPSTIRDI